MKKSILAVATVVCLSFAQANATNLVQMDIKKNSDSAVDVTFFTTGNTSNPMVTRKSSNKYVVLMPNVSGKNVSSPDFSKLKDIIADVNVKNVDDGMNGYTKVTITTTKPLKINTHTQKTGPMTTEEKEAKSIIAQVKTVPVTKHVEKSSAKTTTNSSQTVNKPVQNKIEKITTTKQQTTKKITQKVNKIVETKTQEPTIQEIPVSAPVAVTQNEPVQTSPVKEENKQNSTNYIWIIAIFPILLLMALAKLAKSSVKEAKTLSKYSEEIQTEETSSSVSDYSEIISNKELNWQERYKKFMEQSSTTSNNKMKYKFITTHDTINNIDKKRLELENTVLKTPEIYENQQIDISEDTTKAVNSEDDTILEELNKVKLKAFAKSTTLTTSHRSKVTKLLPKYSHAKEGKFVKLFETPLNATSRRFKNANLKVSDLMNTGNKYLTEKDIEMANNQDYIMSSVEEYFSILDKEQSKKVTNPNESLSKKVAQSLANVKPSMTMHKSSFNQMSSNPIAQKSKNYMDSLVIKASYEIDKNRGFHIVNVDGVSALIGRIGDDISVIKKFDSKVDKLQVRPDGENVYMVKAGNFKSLVDTNNMGVMIEL